jgi:arabinogalactan endo-1,4-beta-galactosidase
MNMNKIRIGIHLIFFVIVNFQLFAQVKEDELALKNSEFIEGVDLSMLHQIEANNGIYKENGNAEDAIQIFKHHNINYVRLRLWHSPSGGYDNLENTLLMASRIKALGLNFLIDIHYSDTWADPGHQTKPVVWQNLSYQELKDSVFQYSYKVISALKNQNTLPDIVQIGNEITCGILWDDGRVCDQFNTPKQWSQLAELINEGIRGVNESLNQTDSVKIMIHIDRGGDNNGSRWFFDHLLAENVKFDVIGLSYYPWWQGTFSDLESNVNDLAYRYGKEIIVVETAYPWTLDWSDNTQNIVGEPGQLLAGYPATVEGQKNFLNDLIILVQNIPNNKGSGIFYWAPEWISVPSLGSPWENVTLFDFAGEVLNSISVFDSIATGVDLSGIKFDSYNLYQNYPNPFNPTTKICWRSPEGGRQTIKVYNNLGSEVCTLVDEYKPAGEYEVEFSTNNLSSGVSARGGYASGVYFYQLRTNNYLETKKMLLLK